MTVDARNLVTLSGGLTRDPETVGTNILKMGLGVDYASNDKNNPSGYFDITYFMSDENNNNVKFVKGQLNQGNFKKGSSISVVGRLQQERWEKDGQKFSKVVVIAESISYFGRKPADTDSNGTTAPRAAATVGATAAPEAPPLEF